MEIRVQGVKAYRSRHGKWYVYHRKTGRRIKSPIGSPAFFSELTELESRARAAPAPLPGTVGALIAAYKESTEFTQLKPRTRTDYRQVFDYLGPLQHDLLIDITAGYVAEVRDAAFKKKKRRFANYVKTVLSLLFA